MVYLCIMYSMSGSSRTGKGTGVELMEKLYYHLPYIKEFEAVVVSCEQGKKGNYEVVLDRTRCV